PAIQTARATVAAEGAEAEPPAAWHAAALGVVERCEAALWAECGGRARSWLHARGLSDETLRRVRVGFNPTEALLGGLKVARGITLPWFVGGELWHVNVRRPVGEPKYKAVAGGHPL